MTDNSKVSVKLPPSFTFSYQGKCDFSEVLALFDWKLRDKTVYIDFRTCQKADYQALSLLVLHLWYLHRVNNCHIEFKHNYRKKGKVSAMWRDMGANQLFHVLDSTKDNFRLNAFKPLVAIRNSDDFRDALKQIEGYARELDAEYEKILRYVITELLYNTLEHGCNPSLPSFVQFSPYMSKNELSFIVADLGIGITRHLRQAYPEIERDVDAIKHALKPRVSGTFFSSKSYEAKNNAGVGLFISHSIIRKLDANMYIVSGQGMVHVSPTDTTTQAMSMFWPGTFVYVTINLNQTKGLNLQKMMTEAREAAMTEIAQRSQQNQQESLYLNIRNYFSRYAEDKSLAIKVRDDKLLPTVLEGKIIRLDFEDIVSAPHSFLSALLATPIQRYGLAAYKKIKIINATPEIRETIDFILDENTTAD